MRTRRAPCRLAALVALCLAACGDDSTTPTPPPQPAPAPPERAPEGVAPGAPDPTDLRAADVRALLDAWLAAQNAGDLEAYSALYAERFEGIKRSGERTYRLDRAGWLADRRRMFARPQVVSADSIAIGTGPRSAVVSFEQTWSAATYRDVGQKTLVVVEEQGALRIAREEMLSSRELASGPEAVLDPRRFMLVLDAGGPSGVVAPGAVADAERGVIELRRRSNPSIASRRAREERLPEAMRVTGREYALLSPTGVECAARVIGVAAVRRVVPHFGTVQYWNGELGDPPRTEPQIAADVWDLGASGAIVAASFDAPEACAAEPLVLAVPTDVATPPLFTPRPADDALVRRAIAAFRAFPAWRAVQSDYATYSGHGAWHEHGGAHPEVYAWVEPRSGRTFVSVYARIVSGCAEFNGALWGFFEDVDGRLVPRVDPSAPGAFEPKAVVDIDGDGTVEVIVPDGLLARGADGNLVPVLDVTPPYFDCDC